MRPLYRTKAGGAYRGRCEDVLRSAAGREWKGKVQLLFTSPPFPLIRPKAYGNRKGRDYLLWLASFAPLFRELLAPAGSMVIEMGNCWEAGRPEMSTLPIRSLLAFQEAAGLHLCQEFIAHNPARLPSPIAWIGQSRERVKDSFTRLWWLAATPRPFADNRRVLREYGASMKRTLGLPAASRRTVARPSGHTIREEMMADHGGSIPDNVLRYAVTSSNDRYLRECRRLGVGPHPARMAGPLVEFFIRLATEPGDLVLDPFAGSNTTGAVAQRLGRRWVAIEENLEYARGSRLRFS